MTTLMFLVAATLLVICLIQFAAILGLRSMLENANAEIESLGDLSDRIKEAEAMADQLSETIETLTKQRDDAIEEVTRISCELAIAKLSITNAQNQVADHVKTTGIAIADREEYRDMLKSIAHIFAYERDLIQEAIKECDDFEAQGG